MGEKTGIHLPYKWHQLLNRVHIVKIRNQINNWIKICMPLGRVLPPETEMKVCDQDHDTES